MSRFTAGVSATESDIRECVFEYLVRRGHFAIRDKQAAGRGAAKSVRLNFPESKGVSDIWGIAKSGQFMAVEVKRPGGVLSVEQHRFLAEVTKRGGLAIVANCLDDVKEKGL